MTESPVIPTTANIGNVLVITVQFQSICDFICDFHDFFTFMKNLKKTDKLRKKIKSGVKKKWCDA